jgi:hypothetical protein
MLKDEWCFLNSGLRIKAIYEMTSLLVIGECRSSGLSWTDMVAVVQSKWPGAHPACNANRLPTTTYCRRARPPLRGLTVGDLRDGDDTSSPDGRNQARPENSSVARYDRLEYVRQPTDRHPRLRRMVR